MSLEKNFFIPKKKTEEIDNIDELQKENIPSNILDQYPENPFETEMFRDAYDSLKRKRDSESENKDAK